MYDGNCETKISYFKKKEKNFLLLAGGYKVFLKK